MNEKYVVITGANSGIGRAAAIKFASEGYHVIMACRNLNISKLAQQEILNITKRGKVDLMQLDISSFESIRKFCTEYRSKYEKLDVLIHNAAHFNHGEKDYQISPDGIELTFATNTFGPFLMTQLLLDLLEKSDDPRILHACTTNIKHFFDPKRHIDFDNLQGENKDNRPYNSYKMYGDSKMGLLMLTFKMANEFEKHGIKVNAIQIPAIKMSKATILKTKSYWRTIARVQNLFLPMPTGMADNYFHICTSDEFKNTTGKYINNEREILIPSTGKTDLKTQATQLFGGKHYPNYADRPELINKMWSMCEELTGVCVV